MDTYNKKKIVIVTMCILSLFVIGATIICAISICSFYSKRYVWLAIGDSITYGEGDNGNSYADYIARKHNDIHVEKKAVGGLKTKEIVLYAKNGFLDVDKSPDLITVLMGTNDFGNNENLEEYGNELEELVCFLEERFPKARIVFLTPLYRDYFGERNYILPGMVNQNGNSLYEYSEIIKKKAIEHGINVLELKEEDYINKDNLKEVTVDGLHPNKKGNKLIAEKIYDDIIKNGQVGL